jgi:NLI interacting factor-like phosphatase
LRPFLEIDPTLRRTVLVDKVFHHSVADINNLIPIIPFSGQSKDDQLPKLAHYLRQLRESEDVKDNNKRSFLVQEAFRYIGIDKIVQTMFEPRQ